MPISRRAFLVRTTALGSAAMISEAALAAVRDDERFFEWKPVAKGAHAALGLGGNTLVVAGASGSLLVDTKFAYCGRQLRREADAIVGVTKLTHVVNTHHHGDHTGGNLAFSPDLPIYAQSKATPRILDQKARYISQMKEAATALKDKTGPAAEQVRKDGLELYRRVERVKITEFAPKTTFDTDQELDVGGGGGLKVNLHHYGPGHTDNDLVVHVPSLNILHTGDLVFNKMHPFIDRDGGATTAGWMASLKEAIKLCDDKTRVVPGHGELGGVEILKAQIGYFEKMRDLVAKEIKSGKSRKDVAEMKPSLYANYGKPDFVGMVLGAIYDELK